MNIDGRPLVYLCLCLYQYLHLYLYLYLCPYLYLYLYLVIYLYIYMSVHLWIMIPNAYIKYYSLYIRSRQTLLTTARPVQWTQPCKQGRWAPQGERWIVFRMSTALQAGTVNTPKRFCLNAHSPASRDGGHPGKWSGPGPDAHGNVLTLELHWYLNLRWHSIWIFSDSVYTDTFPPEEIFGVFCQASLMAQSWNALGES